VSARPVLVVSLVAALGLAAAGCGGGTQSSPDKLSVEAVPFGLLDPTTSTVAPTTVPPATYPFLTYFMGPDGVVPVVRVASTKPTPGVVGKALLAGPTREEVQVGIRNTIPKRSVGRFGGLADGTVAIDLNPAFLDVSGQTQKLALAQIVFTMTSLKGVRRVRFLLDGQPTTVPRINGTITDKPVRRSDYQSTRSR
jgi:spore germination protein GerM